MAYTHKEKNGSCSNICTIIRLQKICKVVGRPLDLDITEMYQQLKEKIFSYRKFKKTAASSRAIFQDRRIKIKTQRLIVIKTGLRDFNCLSCKKRHTGPMYPLLT